LVVKQAAAASKLFRIEIAKPWRLGRGGHGAGDRPRETPVVIDHKSPVVRPAEHEIHVLVAWPEAPFTRLSSAAVTIASCLEPETEIPMWQRLVYVTALTFR